MKRLLILSLCIIMLLCGCDARDEVWGTYMTADGNKSVEFAYSKVFYTLDAKAAEKAEEDEENEAVIEGWYEISDGEVICTFTLSGEDDNTKKHIYTFSAEGDTLTLTGYTVNGEDKPFETEEYKK